MEVFPTWRDPIKMAILPLSVCFLISLTIGRYTNSILCFSPSYLKFYTEFYYILLKKSSEANLRLLPLPMPMP